MAAPPDERAATNDLNDGYLRGLASDLKGGEWPILAFDLDFRKSEITQIKMAHPQQVKEQAYSMLVKWRQSLGTIQRSDVANLVQSLKDLNRSDLAVNLEVMKGDETHHRRTEVNITGDKNAVFTEEVKDSVFSFN